MRNLALADLADEDLTRMLDENETLFVEHKTGFGGDGYQVAKAVCSFANSLGGWVLIGVTKGRPNAGEPDGWNPLPASELTDRVREALKHNRVDPIPAFAATVRQTGDPSQAVGVVRVYESDDAPHVIRGGQVFVRSVAEDAKGQRVYQEGGVETQSLLTDLVARGRRGDEAANERIEDFAGPFALTQLGMRRNLTWWEPASAGSVIVRATPVTWHRMRDWAVSRQAGEALEVAARRLGRLPSDGAVRLRPHASGLAAETVGKWTVGPGADSRSVLVKLAVDQAGIVGASLIWGRSQPPLDPIDLTLNGVRDQLLRPPLDAVVGLLHAGELYGRTRLHVHLYDLGGVAFISDKGGNKDVPSSVPLGGEITLPSEDADVDAVADQWRGDVGRAAGYLELR